MNQYDACFNRTEMVVFLVVVLIPVWVPAACILWAVFSGQYEVTR